MAQFAMRAVVRSGEPASLNRQLRKQPNGLPSIIADRVGLNSEATMPDMTIAVDESRHLFATQKLDAIAYLLSQADMGIQIENEHLYGLGLIIRECVDALRPVDTTEMQ